MERIIKYFINQRSYKIHFGADEITPEDQLLVNRGILYKSTDERLSKSCPICGTGPLTVEVYSQPDDKVKHVIFCGKCERLFVLKPVEYTFYNFDEDKFIANFDSTFLKMGQYNEQQKSIVEDLKAEGDRLILKEMMRAYKVRISHGEKPKVREMAELLFNQHKRNNDNMTFINSEQLRNAFRKLI